MERRYKIMHLPETAMLETLLVNATLPGDCVCKLSFEGVEEGTQVVDRFYDAQWQSEAVLLYNPLWPKLGDGEMATIIPATVKTVVVDLRVPRTLKDCLQPLSKQIGVFDRLGDAFASSRESLERFTALCKEHDVERLVQFSPAFMMDNRTGKLVEEVPGKEWIDGPGWVDKLYPDVDIKLDQGPPVYGGVLESLNMTVADLHTARRILGQDTITDEEAQRRIDAGLPEEILKAWKDFGGSIARMTETPSLDSLHPKEDIHKVAGEPVQQLKDDETWRDRKPLL